VRIAKGAASGNSAFLLISNLLWPNAVAIDYGEGKGMSFIVPLLILAIGTPVEPDLAVSPSPAFSQRFQVPDQDFFAPTPEMDAFPARLLRSFKPGGGPVE
jgi:hypothetical protein